MKNIILIIFLFPIIINAQTFKKVFNFNHTIQPTSAIEINGGYLIGSRASIKSPLNTEIVKLNKRGEITNQIERTKNELESIQELWAINDTAYGALGVFAEKRNSTIKIIYYQLNSSLQITIKDTFYFNKNIPYVLYDVLKNTTSDLYIDKNGNVICVIDLYVKPPYENQMFIVKFNKSGEVLNKNNTIIDRHNSAEHNITSNKNGGYYLTDFFPFRLYSLDSNLNEIGGFDLFLYMYDKKNGNVSDMQWENDTILTMFTGYGTNGFQLGYIRLKIIDNKDEVVGDTLFPYKDPPELVAQNKSIDKFGNYIFITANTNDGFNNRDTNGIRIMKLNKDYSTKWDKVYDFNAYHWVKTITATNDGGCLVTSTEICFTCPRNIDNLYVLKVDSTGYADGADIEDYIKTMPKNKALLFPNPGNNEINLQLPGNNKTAIFSLYNISGKKVLSKQANAIQTTITTGQLPTGLYIYELRKNGVVLDRGKWVKR